MNNLYSRENAESAGKERARNGSQVRKMLSVNALEKLNHPMALSL
jgi:hypothetical protein